MGTVPGDARGRKSHQSGHQKAAASYKAANGKGGCSCSYGRAADALRRHRYTLAVRYVRMDVEARLGII